MSALCRLIPLISFSSLVPTLFRSGNKCERLEPLLAGLVPPVPTVPTIFRITETLSDNRAENPQSESGIFRWLNWATGKSGGNSGNSQRSRGLRAFPLIQRGVNRWEHTTVLENLP